MSIRLATASLSRNRWGNRQQLADRLDPEHPTVFTNRYAVHLLGNEAGPSDPVSVAEFLRMGILLKSSRPLVDKRTLGAIGSIGGPNSPQN